MIREPQWSQGTKGALRAEVALGDNGCASGARRLGRVSGAERVRGVPAEDVE